jgi:hypothetical protein
MPPTNGRAASTGCPTSQFARTPLTACCSYEKNDEETEAKCGGGVGSEVPVPAGGLGAVETAEAAGLVFNEKNAFIVVGVPRGGGGGHLGGGKEARSVGSGSGNNH